LTFEQTGQQNFDTAITLFHTLLKQSHNRCIFKEKPLLSHTKPI